MVPLVITEAKLPVERIPPLTLVRENPPRLSVIALVCARVSEFTDPEAASVALVLLVTLTLSVDWSVASVW